MIIMKLINKRKRNRVYIYIYIVCSSVMRKNPTGCAGESWEREREEHAYRCIIFVSNQPHNDGGSEKGKYENGKSSLYCPRGFK